jgi:hypothetical protein
VKLADAIIQWTPVSSKDNPTAGRMHVWSRAREDGDDGREIEPFEHCHSDVVTPTVGEWRKNPSPLWEGPFLLFVVFHTIVVRDGLDAATVHREFCNILEWRLFVTDETLS